MKNQRDSVKCHHFVVHQNFGTLRSIAHNGYKSQSKELCGLTFTKYDDTEGGAGKIRQIVEMFDTIVSGRLKKNNTFL